MRDAMDLAHEVVRAVELRLTRCADADDYTECDKVVALAIEQAHREGVEAGLKGVELAVALAEDAARAAALATVLTPNMTHYSRDELFRLRYRLSVDGGGRTEVDQRILVAINEELLRRGDGAVTYGVIC